MCFVETNKQFGYIIYGNIVICLPSCVFVLPNEYVFVVKPFKYDY